MMQRTRKATEVDFLFFLPAVAAAIFFEENCPTRVLSQQTPKEYYVLYITLNTLMMVAVENLPQFFQATLVFDVRQFSL